MADAHEPRAEFLQSDVPYVRGWSDARDAARELAEELRLLGFTDDFAYLQGDVSMMGTGFVRLGKIVAETAGRFADALALGLCVEIAELPCADERAPSDQQRSG
ncbi:hypothetical protein LO772_12225 [Yinghuangia sp. ASG 101]|uniref:hypothetical protein n=1 Tax=Yinghuangia sp. ASG 101 TaxID=2896848 RepID=UPI001E319E43|nr:hypothetical protein [Yinghuangia sp. ASG 101]UGQ14282.1 hypothetical protein LO772_12225 [Yinghuangia sp. ASG 101]